MSFSIDQRRTVLLLAICQGLLFTNTVILMAVNALTGYMPWDNKILATLPAMTHVIGSALSAMPAASSCVAAVGFMTGSPLANARCRHLRGGGHGEIILGLCLGTFSSAATTRRVVLQVCGSRCRDWRRQSACHFLVLAGARRRAD